MSLRFHEISEANHRILNPLTDEKLMLLGEVARIGSSTRILDLACGKGEMLCRWAAAHGSGGLGVDLSTVFLAAAEARRAELGVADRVRFVHGDAGAYVPDTRYDVASCLGATWIGDGLAGTVDLLRAAVEPGGLLLVGEPYWHEDPPAEALAERGGLYTDLPGTLDVIEAAGCELVEMVLADGDSWDRYRAAEWWTLSGWLRRHPDHPDTEGARAFLERSRRGYLRYERRFLGWGVFVLRV